MRFATLFLISSILTGTAQAQEASLPPAGIQQEAVAGVLQRTVDDFIRPGYRAFAEKAASMEMAMEGLCASPSPQALGTSRQAFSDIVSAWSTIEIIRVGPAIENNRFERILFYPDRKSTGLKQVQALLAKPDERATSAEALREKSVAMQGLGALEFVLYGTGAETLAGAGDGFRCRYGRAIAENIKNLAQELSAAWEDPAGVQRAWKYPGTDNPLFRTGDEAVTALLGILVHGAETVRDQRLETFYKGRESRSTPKQAIYWRSGETWPSINANLEGLKSLIDRSDIGQLLDPDVRWTMGSIDFVLNSLVRVGRTIDADIEIAVTDPKQQGRLDFMLLNSRDLILRLNDDLGGALGLGAGFSFSDGD